MVSFEGTGTAWRIGERLYVKYRGFPTVRERLAHRRRGTTGAPPRVDFVPGAASDAEVLEVRAHDAPALPGRRRIGLTLAVPCPAVGRYGDPTNRGCLGAATAFPDDRRCWSSAA